MARPVRSFDFSSGIFLLGVSSKVAQYNQFAFVVAAQAHIPTLETTDENRAALLMGLDYLLNISFVDDDEVFKICLDFWNYFVPDVYASVTTGMADANAAFAFGGAAPAVAGRRHLYGAVLSRLRLLMISRMAKPEEVRCSLPEPMEHSVV